MARGRRAAIRQELLRCAGRGQCLAAVCPHQQRRESQRGAQGVVGPAEGPAASTQRGGHATAIERAEAAKEPSVVAGPAAAPSRGTRATDPGGAVDLPEQPALDTEGGGTALSILADVLVADIPTVNSIPGAALAHVGATFREAVARAAGAEGFARLLAFPKLVLCPWKGCGERELSRRIRVWKAAKYADLLRRPVGKRQQQFPLYEDELLPPQFRWDTQATMEEVPGASGRVRARSRGVGSGCGG